jgi:hypothetical protein
MKAVSLFASLFFTACLASAQVTFVFHDGGALGTTGSALDDEAGEVTSTVGGVTLTAEAFLDGSSTGTIFNGASGSFGINASGTGDETQRFDNDLGVESMVLSFDIGGTFDSIDLRFIESATEAELVFDGGTTYQLNSVTATGTSDIATIGETFTAGQTITLRMNSGAAAGSNFALESFTITAVPEPSSFAALLGLGALGFVATRRRGRKTHSVGAA